MQILILTLFFLLFLGIGAAAAYLVINKNQPKKDEDRPITEADTVRALGLRSLVNSENTDRSENEEAKKRLLSMQGSDSLIISKPRARLYTFEYSNLSAEAVEEVIVYIERMAKDIRDCLRQFDMAPQEAQYCSTKDIAASLIFARQLHSKLEERVELINIELAPPTPNHKKAYEIATEGVVLPNDSVFTLISGQNSEPIRWTKLGSTVKELLEKLDYAFAEYGKKKQYRPKAS